ncbi:hypothetical protein DMUE_5029 [Dictyocoela muelleri]|nr:hypothetical protein DMUE_5029 [Dictyocoela muelleri]
MFSVKFKTSISRHSIKNFIYKLDKISLSKCNNTKMISSVKNIKFKYLDKVLKDWIETIEASVGFYTDKILKFKNIQISSELLNSDIDNDEKVTLIEFKASHGWLQNFKHIHCISSKSCSGECFYQNSESNETFIDMIQ